MSNRQAEDARPVSPEELARLAEYARLPLPPERAALLAPLLGDSLNALRALEAEGYDDLQPFTGCRPPGGA